MTETCSLKIESSDSNSSVVFSILSQNPFNKYSAKNSSFPDICHNPKDTYTWSSYVQPIRHKKWQLWVV